MGYYVEVEPEIRVYVEDLNPVGNKAILFIHGWPGNHNLFEYQFDQLPKRGYRCIGMDCRGFGMSDKPWSGYDYDRLADDVKCVIDTLGLRNIALLGHSTGGAIAVRYMARYNSYAVSKLILCAAAVPSLIQRSYFPYGLKRKEVEDIIAQTYTDRPNMLRGFGNMIFFQYKTDPMIVWVFQLGLQAAGWATAAIANTWLNEEELFGDMKKINKPTMILQGIEDKVCLYPLAVAQNEGIRNSKLVPFEQSGHFLFLDQKRKFNEELMRFI